MCLQRSAVNDLAVDGKLAAVVGDDKDADRATAGGESAGEALPEAALVDDGKAGLDLARLGHGDDVTILKVEDAVLLEDGPEHGLDDDAGGRVGDEGGLLVQLLGEEVNTEVTVLASGSRGGDADDLAGAALEHQDITHADVVAGDGDGVGDRGGGGGRAGTGALADNLGLVVVVVGVGNHLVSHLVKTLANRVILSVVVVIAHSRLLLRGGSVARELYSFLNDLGLLGVGWQGLGCVNGNTGDERRGRGVLRDVLEAVDSGGCDRRLGGGGRVRRVGGLGSKGSGGVRRRSGDGSKGSTSRAVVGRGLLADGLGTGAVFTLDAVDARIGGDVLAVYLDCLGSEGRVGRSFRLKTLAGNVGTGTRVMFFFAGEPDLLLANKLLLRWRRRRGDLDRGGD